jgi:hypothetical protein
LCRKCARDDSYCANKYCRDELADHDIFLFQRAFQPDDKNLCLPLLTRTEPYIHLPLI